MTKLTCFRAKNAMLLANFISNTLGVVVVISISRGMTQVFSPEIVPQASKVTWIFLPLVFTVSFVAILRYEKPIRFYLNRLRDQQSSDEPETLLARKKLLNEPFFLIALNTATWLLAAVVFSGFFWLSGAGREMVLEAAFQNIFTGLITITIAFFVFEFVIQRRVVQHVFPEGGLSAIPGAMRIRIRTRMVALLFAINIVPLVSIFGDLEKIDLVGSLTSQSLARLKSIIFLEIGLFLVVGIWVVFLVSSNLTQSLEEIIHVLGRIKRGDFNPKVRVTSNDEIGYTGDVINQMAQGLMERERMRESLHLAQEVQQSLLPKEDMRIEGLDIAGKSLYCDETGGDYFDFIPMATAGEQKVGLAIGDVSGHGASSALLMASVRSYLRLRASQPGSAAQIMTDVNRQLAGDVEDSGQFMTLLFMVLDPQAKTVEWIRAGHDPAMIYNLESGGFTPLDGRGLALGIDGELVYEANGPLDLPQACIIFLSTDGLWEVRNPDGGMLGKAPILDAIRDNAALSAKEILHGILDRLSRFVKGARIEDDITLVIVKIGPESPGAE